ncbi:alcohol dehydrogenase catalytic domain-containing protein [Cohnella ginsengisoli]|uniref:Alcohol dehydrogenase catalytic domain-containing protein n=1 Tax=Cohnella ginsengisoli TaxID=425004 RepID=A0A9X4KJR4_9BACL|nr:alcohol dehydrogenase catalytic domain-containing protein [Cohnella ginsengisoli]MDG0793514.1 alcohol dehydrogenase catalytic domain-containing protein [Cohnella ginsengisoli]
MKTVKAFGPQDLRVVDRADPELGTEDVLVETRACGICGSDKWFWHVETPSDYVAGHEAAGVIVRTGAGVTDFKPGDRVAVNNVKGCGECESCRAGRFVRCGSAPLVHMGFGFAERMAVPARNCLPLDPAIDFEQGALLFDNWGTPYAALKRTRLGAGDSVLVTGCGPIGLATVALCKARGAVVAAVDPIAARREAALRLGASIAFSPDEAAAGRLREVAGDSGFGYGIDCSGKAASYDLIFEHIAIGGHDRHDRRRREVPVRLEPSHPQASHARRVAVFFDGRRRRAAADGGRGRAGPARVRDAPIPSRGPAVRIRQGDGRRRDAA